MARQKVKETTTEAVSVIGDTATVMTDGFMARRTPEILVDALVRKGVKGR